MGPGEGNEEGGHVQQGPGKENGADLFTKPLSWEEIRSNSERMQVQFTNEVVEDLNHMAIINTEVDRMLQREQHQGKVKYWPRVDLGARTFKTTMKGGPQWERVIGRVAMDLDSGEIICSQGAKAITRGLEHAFLPGGARDVLTVLAYR